MRGAPIIQAVIITAVLCLLGFAGMHFIQGGVSDMSNDTIDKYAEGDVILKHGEIAVEIECYFSDKPERYSFLRPGAVGADSGETVVEAVGSDDSPVFHEMVLKNNTLWLDVTWADVKAHGNYFVQLIISVGNEEPLIRTYRSHTNRLQGTIELEIPNLENDDQ